MPNSERTEARIPWKRILAEGAAIVVSILLAFAIDAWWDSRIALRDEHAHLTRLQEEFRTARVIIDAEAAALKEAERATRHLLGLGSTEAARANPDSLALAFHRSFYPGKPNFPSGSLEALVASGDIGLVRDRELASRLAAWPSFVRELTDNADLLIENREKEILPFVSPYVGGLWIGSKTGLLEAYPEARFPRRVSQMFANPTLEGLLTSRAIRIAVTLDRYGELKSQADSIMAALARALPR